MAAPGARNTVIDLRSDTVTRPTAGMRRAMAEAEVGDEQRGDDPTVTALCERVAELVGKQAAVFLPSGTMCNQIAVLVHCQPGDEIIAADVAHLIRSEAAGPAALAGAQTLGVPSTRGIFTAETVEAVVRAPKRNAPRSRLVEIEQTVNAGGGAVWPLEAIEAVAGVARRHGLSMHMDGARLMNAVVAAGTSAVDFCKPFDSVWIDLSKGLGCPIGGVLAGNADFIEECWRWKHRLGGAMRQAGVIAAAGLYALDHHVDRLAEDHATARRLADRLSDIAGLRLNPSELETNLVFFELSESSPEAREIEARLKSEGILIGAAGRTCMRAVTHLDVGMDDVEIAADKITDVLAGLS